MDKKEYDKQYRQKNRDAINSRRRKWREEHKEEIALSAKRYRKTAYARNRDTILSANRTWYYQNRDKVLADRKEKYSYAENRAQKLRRNYGITPEDYNRMYEEQSGQCAICRGYNPLVVDHDHSTGIPRALLCSSCNKALGLAKESPNILRHMAEYLEKGK